MFSITRILGLAVAAALVTFAATGTPARAEEPTQNSVGQMKTPGKWANASCTGERSLATLAKLNYLVVCQSTRRRPRKACEESPLLARSGRRAVASASDT